jgi:uncharacterized protein YprB with RNaseH-like and TPR domain
MIRHTFSVLNGIGEKFERHLWRQGILTWDDFRNCKYVTGLNSLRKNSYDYELDKLSDELSKGNSEFFAHFMKRNQHWRLFEEFKGDAVCLDIETNGLPIRYGGYITLVGFYDGFEWRCLMKNENLTPHNLYRELNGYKYLITFAGTAFDIPFLKNFFSNLKINIPHFDLCTASRKLRLKGGLKKLEALYGIVRDESVSGFDGYDAVKLWRRYQKGSLEARELFLTYNMYDTMNLFKLADILYSAMRTHSGIDDYVR